MSQARRRFGRFDRALQTDLLVGEQTLSGTTVNIGLGGMMVEIDADVPFDTALSFRLDVPSPRQQVEAAGRVLWSRPTDDGRWALGVSFDALRPIDVWALLQYFNLSAGESSAQQAVYTAHD